MSSSLLDKALPDAVDVEAEFRRLAEWWRRETGVFSDLTTKFEHPAYRGIVELGPAVVPVMLHDLETKPAWWLQALMELTGANPIRPEDRGNLARMSNAWVQWGRKNGII